MSLVEVLSYHELIAIIIIYERKKDRVVQCPTRRSLELTRFVDGVVNAFLELRDMRDGPPIVPRNGSQVLDGR